MHLGCPSSNLGIPAAVHIPVVSTAESDWLLPPRICLHWHTGCWCFISVPICFHWLWHSIFSPIVTCIFLFSKVQSLHLQPNNHTLLYAISVWPQFWPQPQKKAGGISGEVSSEYHRVLWIKPLNGAKKVKKNSRIRLGSRCREFESPHSDQKRRTA